jgi:lysophospholipase L1-like esterase
LAGHVVIWLIGSSIIRHGFLAACKREDGPMLGLKNAEFWWQGYIGLGLKDIRMKLATLGKTRDPPNYILLHCGGNDIGKLKLFSIRQEITFVLRYIQTNYPHTKIIWSGILPRLYWKYSSNFVAMEKARKRLNSFGAKQTLALGGHYILHPDIVVNCKSLFKDDGVHLSQLGNDLFLNRLSAVLEAITLRNERVVS